ncbi:MAG: OmpA family protein [Silicimonas sp.]|nr:OmpA family protein [Silicimonas sp.]
MHPTLKNTTALIAALSLTVPSIATAQQGVDACEGNALAITAEIADAMELELNKAQRTALETGEETKNVKLTMVGEERGLCLKPNRLAKMGATDEQIATLIANAGAQAEPGAEATAEAEAETEEATAQAEAEVEVEAEEATAEAETEAEESTAEAEAEAEGAEATAEAEVEAETEEETASADAPVDEELAAEEEAIEAKAVEETAPEEQAQAAEQEAPKETSAAADDTAEAAEVEEVVVTEETSRSSSEEFEGEMQTSAGATAEASGGGGLSDFEKALLVGLGAVVVGKALGDNDDARVVSKSQDRVVVLQDGRYRVIRDDNELIERPGSTVRRETFEDGSSRTVVTRDNGVKVVTIRDPELRVLRRVRIAPDGTRTVLIDDTSDVTPVDVLALPELSEQESTTAAADVETLRAALGEANRADRRFALYQVRNIERVRKLAPAIALDAINFRTGSAVIEAEEARELSDLGTLIVDYISERPNEIFLIEGHTDAVGNAAMNLALSDRRAESVALALTEYFDVPPENLVVQGYGESDLKIRTLDAERANRRAAVRRITPLLTGGS